GRTARPDGSWRRRPPRRRPVLTASRTRRCGRRGRGGALPGPRPAARQLRASEPHRLVDHHSVWAPDRLARNADNDEVGDDHRRPGGGRRAQRPQGPTSPAPASPARTPGYSRPPPWPPEAPPAAV